MRRRRDPILKRGEVEVKTIAIIDTETTGIDPNEHQAIEVACILFDIDSASPVVAYSSLLRADGNPSFAINRIPVEVLASAPDRDAVWRHVETMVQKSDVVAAHNAEFDRGFVHPRIRDAKPWVCTCYDVQWPRATRIGEGLVSLALAHNLGVSHAHRAMTDCDLVSRLFTRIVEMGTDLRAFLAYGLRPKATYQALVSYDDKELAKEHGFRWEAPTKQWLRTMAIEDVASLPFQVRRVTP
jgi:DNA polymerase-3 subunit epsilon